MSTAVHALLKNKDSAGLSDIKGNFPIDNSVIAGKFKSAQVSLYMLTKLVTSDA
jgi:hypothetical protein